MTYIYYWERIQLDQQGKLEKGVTKFMRDQLQPPMNVVAMAFDLPLPSVGETQHHQMCLSACTLPHRPQGEQLCRSASCLGGQFTLFLVASCY